MDGDGGDYAVDPEDAGGAGEGDVIFRAGGRSVARSPREIQICEVFRSRGADKASAGGGEEAVMSHGSPSLSIFDDGEATAGRGNDVRHLAGAGGGGRQ